MSPIPQETIQTLSKYLRYVNYLSTAQLYLKENCLLQQPLERKHCKERILGHWGTVPGQNFIYAHLNYLICKHDLDMLFISGPGHGAPAVLSNLFAEKTLGEYFPELTFDTVGTSKLIHDFSFPGGFPSHVNPGTPGAILEGGELGYSLATAYGAVFDNPNLIAACVIGDGEAETGALSTAWNSHKYINPKDSGAVLPIVHINGYKITGPTVLGTMSHEELIDYFEGLGYTPMIVDIRDTDEYQAHEKMIEILQTAYEKIKTIQDNVRNKNDFSDLRWPVILLQSLKGWTGIQYLEGQKVEGNYRSHGIPAYKIHEDFEEFEKVKAWLESYNIQELIDENGAPKSEILAYVPTGEKRMGKNKHAFGGDQKQALVLSDIQSYEVACYSKDKINVEVKNTEVSAWYIRDLFIHNQDQKNFRFFCPDETESNKYGALFDATERAFLWPVAPHDENIGKNGRVMEMLSEHTLQGWMEGYVLTGRHGIFVTYEAFAMVVSSMVDQYIKFLKQSQKFPWRKPIASLNYILTSIGWRQEHNGYSHQNPSFISNLLAKQEDFSTIYYPCDANSVLVMLEKMFQSENHVNALVAEKHPMLQWITIAQAQEELKTGLGIWNWVDTTAAENPDIVFAATGDVMVQECMAAIEYLKKALPEIKVRFVNVSQLSPKGIGNPEIHSASHSNVLEQYFTDNKPVIFCHHGYPSVIQQLVYKTSLADRCSIHGYEEEGSTTTPFDMLVLNKTSRFDLVLDALAHLNIQNFNVKATLEQWCTEQLQKHHDYIREFGKDMDEVLNWKCTL